MQQGQRHLSFNKFVEERAVEIGKFLGELEQDTKKKGHQAMPKSIRRRAMSHNRFRIPRKLRRNIEEELVKAENMQKLPKCRKHIRKRRHLVTAYKLRSTRQRWLSTHLWAAKRMRMLPYAAYSIAYTPNDKSFRTAYRHFRHNATLNDLSYLQVLALRLPASQQISFTSPSPLPEEISLRNNEIPSQYDKIYHANIFASGERTELICPAYLLRTKDEGTEWSFKLFFDPNALPQVRLLKLPKWSASLEESQIDIYFLAGPQAASVLTTSLKSYGILPENVHLNQKLYHKDDQVLYLSKEDSFSINNKPLIDAPLREQKMIKQAYDRQENVSLRRNMLQLYKNALSKTEVVQEKEMKAFWKYYEEGQNRKLEDTIFKVTLRSRYTHKRKNKLTKQQKKIALQIERESPSEKRKKRDTMKDQNELSESNNSKAIFIQTPHNPKTACIQEVHPLLIAQITHNSLFKGLLIMASNANSCRLWRILTHQHIKVIGRREFAHMHLESKHLLYPEDYAGTAGFNLHAHQQEQKLFAKFVRIPLQKRPHYFQLNSPSPFPILPTGRQLILSFEMVSRGRCFEGSYICELLREDLEGVNSKLQEGKIGIVLSEQSGFEGKRKQYKTLGEMSEDLKAVTSKRKIVGKITSGGFLFSRSHEGGIGYVNQDLLSVNYLTALGGYFLIRKVSSPHYMLALASQQRWSYY